MLPAQQTQVKTPLPLQLIHSVLHLQSVTWDRLLPSSLVRFGNLRIFEVYLEICLPGLVSGRPNSWWLDGALLGLIQPLHGDDTKHRETCSSQKSAVLGTSAIFFFLCFQQNFSCWRAGRNPGRN